MRNEYDKCVAAQPAREMTTKEIILSKAKDLRLEAARLEALGESLFDRDENSTLRDIVLRGLNPLLTVR